MLPKKEYRTTLQEGLGVVETVLKQAWQDFDPLKHEGLALL